MSDLNTYKVTDREVQENGLQGVVGDRLNLTPNESKLRFDQLPDLIRTKFNNALDRIDTLVAQTNAQTKSEINTTLTDHNTRLTNIEGRIDGDSFVANVNGSSTFSINTNRAYADVNTGTVAISTIIGQLGANTNSLKSALSLAQDKIDEVDASAQKLSEYDNGSRFGSNINGFTTAGTYLTSASLSNLPNGLSGKKLWITVRRETPTSSTIYQEIENAERYVEGSTTHQIGRWYRVSTNGGSTWSAWSNDGAIEHKIYGGTNLENSSYIRIGEVLICMGYVSMKPTSAKRQYNKRITFPMPFAFEPHVQTSFGWSPETLVVISANDATARDFNLALYSDTTSERRIRWMAIGKAVV